MSPKKRGSIVALILVVIGGAANAKNLEVLTRVLFAADLADQAATYCATVNLAPVHETGALGNMRSYAEHIKKEVTYNLRQVDALSVMKKAADEAKAEIAARIGAAEEGDPANVAGRVSSWCEQTAAPLIRSVISTHDDHHQELDVILAKSKAE